MESSDNTLSGGLLVVLGIIVGIGALYFFSHNMEAGKSRDINIQLPSPSSTTTPGSN